MSGSFAPVFRGRSIPSCLSSFVNGAYTSKTASRSTFSRVCPATARVVGECVAASDSDMEIALAGAREAQRTWALTAPATRSAVLTRAADILDGCNDDMAALEAWDTGRPIAETRVVDIKSASDCLRFFGAAAATARGHHQQLDGGNFALITRSPLGVAAGIGAWNYPIQGCAWKLAPCLAAGNSMVFKPSEHTPITALLLAEVLIEAGAPSGLFNVLLGDGAIGAALASNSDVDKVSFTGSAATGRKVAAAAGSGIKRVTLELGGKSPLIVFADAGLEDAVSAAMIGNWFSCGEVCSNATRVFVHEDIYPAFVERLLERTRVLQVGDPMDPKTDIGALIHEQHFASVSELLRTVEPEGGNVLFGGMERVSVREGGFYMAPTVIECGNGDRDGMIVAKQELFAPVMSLFSFREESEVVRRANATDYGLSAGVFTKDIQRAHRVSNELNAGTVWINNYNLTPVEVPWGGHKGSGIGFENSVDALSEWSQCKTVYVEMGSVSSPYA